MLGIRSPWASAWVTEDLHHDMGDTRLHRGPLGMAIVFLRWEVMPDPVAPLRLTGIGSLSLVDATRNRGALRHI